MDDLALERNRALLVLRREVKAPEDELGAVRLFRDTRMALIEDGTNDVLSLIGAHQILNESA